MRKERDSMGEVSVPDDSYYGAQTQRAKENFNVSGKTIPFPIIKALGYIKKSAAIINNQLYKDRITDAVRDSIQQASDEIIDGKLNSQFVVDVFQTGSGTSSNMNINEVIANRANEIMGSEVGSKFPVHPNDHVNFGQSSNDVFPTAISISVAMETKENLLPILNELKENLASLSKKFAGIIKIGRTHLQDATPISLGQEFSGYSSMIEKDISRIMHSLKDMCYLAQGGTAVGTGINTHKDFGKLMSEELSKSVGIEFKETNNHFEAQSCQNSSVEFSGSLKTLAVSLSKIANDIRLMGSGPRSGIGELILPAVQPGSSIMPGKVNPVICESLIQVSAEVIGNDLSITLGGLGSYFELNLMLPLIANNLIESITLLSNGIKMFNDKLLNNLEVNKKVCNDYVEGSLAMCTSLVPVIGYDKAAEIAYKAYKEDKTIREVVLEMKLLDKRAVEKLLDPHSMIKPSEAGTEKEK